MVSKTIEFTSTIRDDNPIHDFPFDKQELTLELEMTGAGTRDSIDYGRYFVRTPPFFDTLSFFSFLFLFILFLRIPFFFFLFFFTYTHTPL
jgi:hypothetical protein